MSTTITQLCDTGFEILSDRHRWEQKQRVYYQMRLDGLRRRNKPFPTCADLHLALIDEAIGKSKPFWMAQALNNDRLAHFIAMRRQLDTTTESSAEFFNFEMMQRTDFRVKLESAVDTMLLRGRGILKAFVNPFDNYKIVVEHVDPLFILMPTEDAIDFEDADQFIHVRHLSVPKYRRDQRWTQDEDVIRRIRGSRDQDFSTIFADKELHEGLTHTLRNNTIVIWEHYLKTSGGWSVYAYSPQAQDVELRKPHGVPYRSGGKPSLPFYSFVREIVNEGWYAPRGIAEIIAPYEQYGTKVWNEKADNITFSNRPLLTSETPIQNPSNYRWQPGEYVPGNLKGVQMPAPVISYDNEIAFARGNAEQLIQMPDFGVDREGRGGSKEPRKATEINYIASLQSTGTNHQGGIFRNSLAKFYAHCWGLMCQYKRPQLTYFVAGDLQELPQQALHDEYLVMPDGAPDQWNKDKRLQRAIARLQLFKGAPNVDQDELAKDVLAADDARLVTRMFTPTNMHSASEAQQEGMDILLLQDGFPAAVLPGQDHAIRVKILLGWLHKQGMTRQPLDAMARTRIQQHLAVHMQFLRQTQPDAFRQIVGQIKQAERAPMQPQAQTQPLAPAAAPTGNGGGRSIPLPPTAGASRFNMLP